MAEGMKESRLSKLNAAADLAWESALEADPEKRAPLLAQYRGLLSEIDQLDKSGAGDPIDEIAQRRTARGAGAAASSLRTKRSG